jgi:GT2 family glycosyltransferase
MTLKDVTVAIKTFERRESLVALINSIRRLYPSIAIVVADDSKKPYAEDVARSFSNVQCITLKFDVGVSAGRNAMLARSTTKYLVLCDDDFLFYEQTRLEEFTRILEETDIELVAGCVMEKADTGEFSRCNCYAGNLILDMSRNLRMDPIKPKRPFSRCDIVANWFMANADAIRRTVGGWDSRLKVEEHTDFFWRAKAGGLKVASTPYVKVQHTLATNSRYDFYRHTRTDKYYRLYFRKLGLNSFTDTTETVTLEDVKYPWWLKVLLRKLRSIAGRCKRFSERILS